MGIAPSQLLVPIVSSMVAALVTKLFSKPANPAPMPTRSTPQTAEQLRTNARNKLGIDCVNCYNFGFVGSTGVGKSSIINALRGLKESDHLAAPVDVKECTQEIKNYPMELPYNHIVLWDIPGAGTVNHPGDTYFQDKCLYALDYLVIMFSERLREDDVQIAKACARDDVPFCIVRTKADQSIDSLMRGKRLTQEEAKRVLRQKTYEEVRNAFSGAEERSGFTDSLKVVSNVALIGGDEERLKYSMDEDSLYCHVVDMAWSRRNVENEFEKIIKGALVRGISTM